MKGVNYFFHDRSTFNIVKKIFLDVLVSVDPNDMLNMGSRYREHCEIVTSPRGGHQTMFAQKVGLQLLEIPPNHMTIFHTFLGASFLEI